MSRRFKWLAIIAYGGVLVSALSLVLLILGFGRVGDCSTVDNTWEACETRTDFLATMLIVPILASAGASVIAVFVRPKPGEKGKWLAASSILVAPPLCALLIWGLTHLGIR